jgi:transposase-like protein
MEPTFLAKYFRFKCKGCKKQFTVKTGTVMEESPLKIEIWLAAFWLVCNAKNGISSHEIGRALGVTQKSAWFLVHRIRVTMQTGTIEKKLSETVEADEMFLGGLEKNKHASKRTHPGGGGKGKMIVMGLLERHSKKVRTKHIPNTNTETLQGEIRRNVRKDTAIYTDGAQGYLGLNEEYWHESVNHLDEWVRGNVHTNSLENYWSLFKRCFSGTWTHLSDEHLHRYLVEQEFRFNNKEGNDGDRFTTALGQVNNKRMTYKDLIAAG